MESEKSTVKTLHKVVDYLIHESAEDVCQICAYLYDFPETPDNVDPCPFRRKNGCSACREGMIKYFTEQNNE